MAEINIVVTPDSGEIIQGQRADTKRPEADRVSEIAGLLSGYPGQVVLYGDAEEEGEAE